MRTRTEVLEKLQQGVVTTSQAAQLLGLCDRQVRRLRAGYRRQGASALWDRRCRGEPRALSPTQQQTVLRLKQQRYGDFSVQHFYEFLVREHGFTVSYSTVLRLLQRHGTVQRSKRPGQYRRRRARQPMRGMRLHLDGSPHRWLGANRAVCTLLTVIDDATSDLLAAQLVDQETTAAVLGILYEVVGRYGCFGSLYTDKGSAFFDHGRDTAQHQVSRALRTLAITQIFAQSPQARGRSERNFRTLQDRLINELALYGITTIQGANAFLHKTFIPQYRARFSVPPLLEGNAFVSPPCALDLQLIFSAHYPRVVRHDFTVRFAGQPLQLPPDKTAGLARKTVIVHVFADTSLGISKDGRLIGCYYPDGRPAQIADDPSPLRKRFQPQPSPPPIQPVRPPSAGQPDHWQFLLDRSDGPTIPGIDLHAW